MTKILRNIITTISNRLKLCCAVVVVATIITGCRQDKVKSVSLNDDQSISEWYDPSGTELRMIRQENRVYQRDCIFDSLASCMEDDRLFAFKSHLYELAELYSELYGSDTTVWFMGHIDKNDSIMVKAVSYINYYYPNFADIITYDMIQNLLKYQAWLNLKLEFEKLEPSVYIRAHPVEAIPKNND